MTCKKLIEVAMPVKEISTESVRDKSNELTWFAIELTRTPIVSVESRCN